MTFGVPGLPKASSPGCFTAVSSRGPAARTHCGEGRRPGSSPLPYLGRKKIQDKYKEEPFRVVSVPREEPGPFVIQRDGETPRCVSAGEIRKFKTPPPQVVKNLGWCVVVPGRPPSASVATDEQSLVTVDESPQPRSRRPSLLPVRRQPRRDTRWPARYT